jgi:NitT/TauT family transport system permease protein
MHPEAQPAARTSAASGPENDTTQDPELAVAGAEAGSAAASGGTRRRPPSTRRRYRRALIVGVQIAILVVWLGSWQLTADHGVVNKLFTSEPRSIWRALRHGITDGNTLHALGTTMYETAIGFALSVVIGTAIGIAMYSSTFLREVIQPFVAALNSLPRLALVPLFILWFGIGSNGRIALIVTMASFVVLINTLAGLQNTSRDQLVLAQTLGAKWWQRYLKFILPTAAPTLFAGLQLALTYSFLAAVISELISGGDGLGAEIANAQSNFDTAGMFADIVVIGVVAAILSALMRFVERHLLAWRDADLRGVQGGARRTR